MRVWFTPHHIRTHAHTCTQIHEHTHAYKQWRVVTHRYHIALFCKRARASEGERERARARESERERERARESERERERESERQQERARERERQRDWERERQRPRETKTERECVCVRMNEPRNQVGKNFWSEQAEASRQRQRQRQTPPHTNRGIKLAKTSEAAEKMAEQTVWRGRRPRGRVLFCG